MKFTFKFELRTTIPTAVDIQKKTSKIPSLKVEIYQKKNTLSTNIWSLSSKIGEKYFSIDHFSL